jgi:hypothetical protein
MLLFIIFLFLVPSLIKYIYIFYGLRYITYSKEEEAVRCIQNVHGFLLDGRSLR